MKTCKAKGCGVWDCDNCHNTLECNNAVICDVCNTVLTDEYYSVENVDLCEDCLKERFRELI